MEMANRKRAGDSGEMNGTAITAEKRVILSMGGKGGVGKTSLMTMLAEWFAANDIPVKLLGISTPRTRREDR
jgi:Mrp family chromosome partitioning ATPase